MNECVSIFWGVLIRYGGVPKSGLPPTRPLETIQIWAFFVFFFSIEKNVHIVDIWIYNSRYPQKKVDIYNSIVDIWIYDIQSLNFFIH